MTDILKPCPFCGSIIDINDSDTLYPNGEYSYNYNSILKIHETQLCHDICCDGCGAEVHGDSRKETIDKWNTRK